MNGKTARAFRKVVGYHPRNERDYHRLEFQVDRFITQLKEDKEGNMSKDYVKRKVPAFLVECVSADRKLYKAVKKKYYKPDHEQEFSKLPSKGEMYELAETIKDRFQADSRRGVFSSDQSYPREKDKEGGP